MTLFAASRFISQKSAAEGALKSVLRHLLKNDAPTWGLLRAAFMLRHLHGDTFGAFVVVVISELYGDLWVVFQETDDLGRRTFSAHRLTERAGEPTATIEGVNKIEDIKKEIDRRDGRPNA